jgi:hypothetical protein
MAGSHSNYNHFNTIPEYHPQNYLNQLGLEPIHHGHGMVAGPDYQHYGQLPTYVATTMTLSQFEALQQQGVSTAQAVCIQKYVWELT